LYDFKLLFNLQTAEQQVRKTEPVFAPGKDYRGNQQYFIGDGATKVQRGVRCALAVHLLCIGCAKTAQRMHSECTMFAQQEIL
jgi:hypothetical protein